MTLGVAARVLIYIYIKTRKMGCSIYIYWLTSSSRHRRLVNVPLLATTSAQLVFESCLTDS